MRKVSPQILVKLRWTAEFRNNSLWICQYNCPPVTSHIVMCVIKLLLSFTLKFYHGDGFLWVLNLSFRVAILGCALVNVVTNCDFHTLISVVCLFAFSFFLKSVWYTKEKWKHMTHLSTLQTDICLMVCPGLTLLCLGRPAHFILGNNRKYLSKNSTIKHNQDVNCKFVFLSSSTYSAFIDIDITFPPLIP